jgi:hypothetical protein
MSFSVIRSFRKSVMHEAVRCERCEAERQFFGAAPTSHILLHHSHGTHIAMDNNSPLFHRGTNKNKKRRNKLLLLSEATVLSYEVTTMVERAENSYERCQTRCAFRDTLLERRSSLLATDFKIVFRCSLSAMEQLRNELYPLQCATYTKILSISILKPVTTM